LFRDSLTRSAQQSSSLNTLRATINQKEKLSTFLLATALFFFSGALGLGYELVWIRKSALIVGASQIALATVLTSFFLGLGLGSLAVGRYLRSERWSPLFLYGLFEAAIGAFALSFPALFRLVELAYGALYPLLASSGLALFLLRFALLFLLFLFPTFCMGGTLPLLLDGLVERERTLGSLTSFLYGINILGAVAGVIVTSYWAIPSLGMSGASIAGGAGNLLIGAAALIAFRKSKPIHGGAAIHGHGSGRVLADGASRFFSILSFLSGLVAIGYQVAWARYFSLFNVSSVYLTAILLAVYLLALAAGSLLVGQILRWGASPLRLLTILQPLAPLLVLPCLEAWRLGRYQVSMIGDTSELLQSYEVRSTWHFFNETVDTIFFAPLVQVALTLFLPVLFLGSGLPAILSAAARRTEELRAVSGKLVFLNTLGSSAGGFLAGYVLLPGLGLGGSLCVLALGSFLIAVLSEWRLGQVEGSAPRSPLSRPGYLLSAIGVLACFSFLFARGDVTRRTIRDYGWGATAKEDKLVDVVEGPLTTAFVFDGAERLSVGSANVCLAVVEYQMPSTQAIQGHIPALFYPKPGAPENCLGICLGSGQSFGALLLYPVKRLDVVDISKEMIDLSLKYFEPYNHDLKKDPRVQFHLDDGRHFVDRAPGAFYDVVSMEPPPPAAEGVYGLYSLEFYGSVRRILRDGGVFMQWLPLYRVTPRDASGIVRTQAEVFPHTFVVKVGKTDFMVVSFQGEAPRFSTALIRERIKTFEKERLVSGNRWEQGCRHEIASLEGVLSLLVSGPEDISRQLPPILYHDDDQRLSYSSGDRELLRRHEGPLLAPVSFAALPLTPFESLKKYFQEPIPAGELEAERARSLVFYQVPDPAWLSEAGQAFSQASDPATRVRVAMNIALRYDQALAKDKAFSWIDKALSSNHQEASEELIKVARFIVLNRIAVYEARAREWIGTLARAYPKAPLVRAMQLELQAHEARERERRKGYLFQE
jgi:spermidine synthase